ncbi:hypothetical protein [Marseilla massiliensis]|uniref:Uncharacterized protein n=1 Tax=Marseilla massiliensis TaxID=1841864 RepID=A0A938WTU9_9BACT|nr:hypothetical protein [Marseilla massiliensis]MBM6675032.1 hypothetical protein [Marseilla massiliensis]
MKIDKNFFTGKIFKPTQRQLHISDRNECAKGYLEERRYLEESGFEVLPQFCWMAFQQHKIEHIEFFGSSAVQLDKK